MSRVQQREGIRQLFIASNISSDSGSELLQATLGWESAKMNGFVFQ